ncbi:MAG: hypothetical protein V4621_07425 [Pseudomonadota bacterium]
MRVTYELEQGDMALLLDAVRESITVATAQATDDEAGLLAAHRLTRLTALRRRLDAPVMVLHAWGGGFASGNIVGGGGGGGGGAAKPTDTGAGGVFVPRVDNGCGTEVGQGASAPLPNCVEGSQLCPICGKWLA